KSIIVRGERVKYRRSVNENETSSGMLAAGRVKVSIGRAFVKGGMVGEPIISINAGRHSHVFSIISNMATSPRFQDGGLRDHATHCASLESFIHPDACPILPRQGGGFLSASVTCGRYTAPTARPREELNANP